ncbi:MAG: hypothetical protein DRI61_11380 [Chloroflexi bacterium]|nr:MAG: hypothetical protein DRI61_11380 [Chloroflexota bacterium]
MLRLKIGKIGTLIIAKNMENPLLMGLRQLWKGFIERREFEYIDYPLVKVFRGIRVGRWYIGISRIKIRKVKVIGNRVVA